MFSEASVIQQQYINASSVTAFKSFTDALQKHIEGALERGSKSLVFVCIGTDRSTGDSLGPLIGHKIAGISNKGVHVYGTLENPVHAKNLSTIMERIAADCDNPFVIAIDACLGSMEHIGYVGIGPGPVKPGAGVNKNLPPVGDMYVTGIVNFGGYMDFLILQNTRLHTVMKIADLIASGIRFVIWRLSRSANFTSDIYTSDI